MCKQVCPGHTAAQGEERGPCSSTAFFFDTKILWSSVESQCDCWGLLSPWGAACLGSQWGSPPSPFPAKQPHAPILHSHKWRYKPIPATSLECGLRPPPPPPPQVYEADVITWRPFPRSHLQICWNKTPDVTEPTLFNHIPLFSRAQPSQQPLPSQPLPGQNENRPLQEVTPTTWKP